MSRVRFSPPAPIISIDYGSHPGRTQANNLAHVTTVNAYGESDDGIVKPPWTLSFLAVPHSTLSVSAETMGPRGDVTCSITVDGRTLQNAEVKGEGSLAACNVEAP